MTAQCSCPDIPENENPVISVQTVPELVNALDQANSNNGNMTILLEPGVYELNSNLRFINSNMSNLSIMGASGNKDDVYIKGQGWDDSAVTHIFNVAADQFVAAHMTIGEVFYHPIQVHSNPSDADDFTVQNVKFVDAKEQLLKVSGGGSLFADRGKVLCCEFEFTNGIAYQFYTGGIDAHRAKDWVVTGNIFKHIRSPEVNLAEHAIHFWRESEGTIVEANQVINCDRGIGFGLGSSTENGHSGGMIANNFVHTSRDVGIGLEAAQNALVYNNTVVTDNYNNSIEYRFPLSNNIEIINNLVNETISDRSSGSSASLLTNVTISDMSVFLDAANYDYHIVGSPSDIVDVGTPVNSVITDFDCADRVIGLGIDIGAHEQTDLMIASDLVLQNDCIEFHPNPIPGLFSITGILANYDIQLVDSNGTVLQDYQTQADIQINLSDLPSGLYFVTIAHVNKTKVQLQTIIRT